MKAVTYDIISETSKVIDIKHGDANCLVGENIVFVAQVLCTCEWCEAVRCRIKARSFN